MASWITYHACASATSTVMEEGGTELEAEAEEDDLEGAVRHTCEDMELEEGDTELEEGELAEDGELAGATELEATLFAPVFLIVQGTDCAALTPLTRPLCPLLAALAPPALPPRPPAPLPPPIHPPPALCRPLSLGLQLHATLLRWPH